MEDRLDRKLPQPNGCEHQGSLELFPCHVQGRIKPLFSLWCDRCDTCINDSSIRYVYAFKPDPFLGHEYLIWYRKIIFNFIDSLSLFIADLHNKFFPRPWGWLTRSHVATMTAAEFKVAKSDPKFNERLRKLRIF